MLFFSCSKEEDIPFKESAKDSIDVTSYKDISGKYMGTVVSIKLLGDTAYTKIGPEKPHTVEITSISFDRVLCLDISPDFSSDAEADMFRYNQNSGFFKFLPYSMSDSAGADSVINGQFSGVYFYNKRSLEYYMYYIENKDTIRQVFKGILE